MKTHIGPFIRFVIVGAFFALVFSLTTAALISIAGTPPFLTSAIVYLLCIPPAYQTQKRFSFGADKTRKSAFPIYLLTQFFCLSLVSGTTSYFVTYDFWLDATILLAVSVVAAVASFSINRFITFATPKQGR